MNQKTFMAALFLILGTSGSMAFGEETTGEKVGDAAHAVKKDVVHGARNVEDKTCHLVDGKMQCAGKKIKHKVQNGADDVKDAVKGK